MTLMLLVPCAKMVGGVLAAKAVWRLIGDLVLDRIDLPLA